MVKATPYDPDAVAAFLNLIKTLDRPLVAGLATSRAVNRPNR